MSENQSDRPQIRQNPNNTLLTVIKFVVVAVFMLPLVHYSFFRKNSSNSTDDADQSQQNDMNLTEMPSKPVTIKRLIVKQPTCPPPDPNSVLDEICSALYRKYEECTPEDVDDLEKHKIVPRKSARNNTANDPRGTIVGCVATGLLLTSLGAALIEFYKAKIAQTPVKKSKTPFSRKCSLADLTVLKHARKELIRRESILELPEKGANHKPAGRNKVTRPDLRLE